MEWTEEDLHAGGATRMTMPEKTRQYLSDPALADLWIRVRRRLETTGHKIAGTVTVNLDDEAAQRLSGLLGQRTLAGRRRLRLDDLDAALRNSAARSGLVPVVAQLTGGSLRDRPSERLARGDTLQQLWCDVETSLSDNGFGAAAWARSWVEWLHHSTLLVRGGDHAVAEFDIAARALAIVLADPRSRRMLGELANTVGGSSHALDSDQLAGRMAVRGLSFALDIEDPETPRDRIELWEQVDVSVDRISGTVLTWGFRPPGNDPWSRMMNVRADLGLISHLTLAELAVAPHRLVPATATISGCENPQVLQRIAESGIARPAVCFSGNPSSAGQLLAERVRLRYHGDFDWPGVAIAGRLIAAGAEPWRMGAEDYLRAVSSGIPRIPLSGRPVMTSWDLGLQVEMEHADQAVHEESVMDELLGDL
ncbi:TIGR02679 domain-containing protein [Nocardia sp. NPDC057272]|uniref:TIGR02679 domain-containing protein n=1 Tax=Nocardia sp. NPDC057272 TaxID=3346079 RepID=UPI0036308E18